MSRKDSKVQTLGVASRAGAAKPQTTEKVHKMVLTGLMAALSYVAFTYLKIPIPTFGGDMVALHIGNAFCVLAALLLGGSGGDRKSVV